MASTEGRDIISVHYSLIPVQQVEPYLPGITQSFTSSLWFSPVTWEFHAGTLDGLIEACAPLRLIVSLTTSPENAEWVGLLKKPILQGVVHYPWLKRSISTTVGWLATDQPQTPKFLLKYSNNEYQSAFAFLPYNEVAALKWAKISYGAVWLWLCDEWIANAPQPALDSWSVALSYLRLTSEINGIAGLVWTDANMKTGVTFFGNEEILRGMPTVWNLHFSSEAPKHSTDC